VARTDVGKTQRLDLMLIVFMEGSKGFGTSGVNFNRAAIDLGNCLNLDVVSPNSILRFSFHILLNVLSSIILKESFLVKNVVQANCSDLSMVLFGACIGKKVPYS
jgi:hypothetical protein